MARRLWALALVGLVAVGCGHGGGAGVKKRPVVGVTLLTQTHDFYKELEQGLREEADAARPRPRDHLLRDGPGQAGGADRGLRGAEGRGDPGRAVRLGRDRCRTWRGRSSAGIPVFTADIAAHGGKIVSHVASDNVQGGRLAAQALARAAWAARARS